MCVSEKKGLVRKKKKKKKKERNIQSLQHQQFPGGLPSQYYAGPTLLNFSVQMGTGAFNVVWPQTLVMTRNGYLYQSTLKPFIDI